MAGIPLFDATLTLTFPDQSTRALRMGWTPTGSLIPYGAMEDHAEWLDHLNSFGESVEVTSCVVLDEDPSVVSEVDWLDEQGFVPKGTALADWVRKTYPEDCAYLDEIRFPATALWHVEGGKKYRMAAWWHSTGEVRPRFLAYTTARREKNDHRMLETLKNAPPGTRNMGTISLDMDPSVTATVHVTDEEPRLVAPCAALAPYVAAKQV